MQVLCVILATEAWYQFTHPRVMERLIGMGSAQKGNLDSGCRDNKRFPRLLYRVRQMVRHLPTIP